MDNYIYTTMAVAAKQEQSDVDRLLDRPESPPKIVGKCPVRVKYADISAYHPVPYADGGFDSSISTVYLNSGVVLTINYAYQMLDAELKQRKID